MTGDGLLEMPLVLLSTDSPSSSEKFSAPEVDMLPLLSLVISGEKGGHPFRKSSLKVPLTYSGYIFPAMFYFIYSNY